MSSTVLLCPEFSGMSGCEPRLLLNIEGVAAELYSSGRYIFIVENLACHRASMLDMPFADAIFKTRFWVMHPRYSMEVAVRW